MIGLFFTILEAPFYIWHLIRPLLYINICTTAMIIVMQQRHGREEGEGGGGAASSSFSAAAGGATTAYPIMNEHLESRPTNLILPEIGLHQWLTIQQEVLDVYPKTKAYLLSAAVTTTKQKRAMFCWHLKKEMMKLFVLQVG